MFLDNEHHLCLNRSADNSQDDYIIFNSSPPSWPPSSSFPPSSPRPPLSPQLPFFHTLDPAGIEEQDFNQVSIPEYAYANDVEIKDKYVIFFHNN
jgi:hypothetical protein